MAWVEKDFEEEMTPYIDKIYKGLFKGIKSINRSNRDNKNNEVELFMDMELAIDTIIKFNDGSLITFQEKTRRNKFISYDDFTFEYYNDPRIKEEGEWFKLTSQYYFYGYSNTNKKGYTRFYIIDVPKLRIHLKNNIGIEKLEREYLKTNRPPARSNFFAIPFEEIPNNCFLYNKKRGIINV